MSEALKFSFPGMCDSSPSCSFQKHAILAGCIFPIHPPFPPPFFSPFSGSCLYSRTTPETHCQRPSIKVQCLSFGSHYKRIQNKTDMGWVCLLSYQNILKKKNQPSKQYNDLELYANGYIKIDPRINVEIVLVTQACPTLCSFIDCSPLGSSDHGIFKARILEWGAIPFSRRSSPPKD